MDGFIAARAPLWSELEDLLARQDELSPAEVLRLGAAYRGTLADLALARRRYAGTPVVPRLEDQVLRGRAALLGTGSRRDLRPALTFLRRGWWQLAAAGWRWTAAAAGLLVGAILTAAGWAAVDPRAATRTLPIGLQRLPFDDGRAAAGAGLRAGTAPLPAGTVGLPRGIPGVDVSWTAWAAVGVAVLALAGGVLAGLGTAAVLLSTGLQLGVPLGLAATDDLDARVLLPLMDDGLLLLVLTCLVAAGGLRAGAAVLDPGARPRREALADEARSGVLLLLGALPLYAVALALQTAVRPVGAAAVAPFGVGATALLVLGLALLGRPAPGPTPGPTSGFP